MTVDDLIETLQLVKNKSIEVIFQNSEGFINACSVDTGIAQDAKVEEVFYIAPCTCHWEENEPIEIAVEANHFEENPN